MGTLRAKVERNWGDEVEAKDRRLQRCGKMTHVAIMDVSRYQTAEQLRDHILKLNVSNFFLG